MEIELKSRGTLSTSPNVLFWNFQYCKKIFVYFGKHESKGLFLIFCISVASALRVLQQVLMEPIPAVKLDGLGFLHE